MRLYIKAKAFLHFRKANSSQWCVFLHLSFNFLFFNFLPYLNSHSGCHESLPVGTSQFSLQIRLIVQYILQLFGIQPRPNHSLHSGSTIHMCTPPLSSCTTHNLHTIGIEVFHSSRVRTFSISIFFFPILYNLLIVALLTMSIRLVLKLFIILK